ncbi:smoothelin-like protein 1 [Rhopilema esculentum]|uniref:smoothelin-like protein 1 n=1 Tax=Rhopilema esculentum TaxID=499914 RepID=UPI0031D619AE
MEALKRQEEQLKSKLEDADTIMERRKVRAELREIRNQIATFTLKEDENANVVDIKMDLNSNIITNKEQSSTEIKPVSKVAETASNSLKNPSSPQLTRNDRDYRVTDDSEQLRIKTAEERANRRARRQERMNKLAKEQTDDSKTSDEVETRNEKNKLDDKKPISVSTRPRSFVRDNEVNEVTASKSSLETRQSGFRREANKEKEDSVNKTEVGGFNQRNYVVGKKIEKDDDVNGENITKMRNVKTEEKADRKIENGNDDKLNSSAKGQLNLTLGINKDKGESSPRSPVSINKTITTTRSGLGNRPEKKFEQTSQHTSTTSVNTPKSFTGKFERKEERTVQVKIGDKKEEVSQSYQCKSMVMNGQQTSQVKTTTSRVSSAFDRFNGSSSANDSSKKQAANAIGKALNFGIGSARNKFLAAEKVSPTKPSEPSLNFTKKFDSPGYTVKKFTETKVEQKSSSSGPIEFGLSFTKKTETRSNLKETGQDSVFKKTSPSPHPRHQSAPAPTGQPISFKLPGGGAKTSSVADRMKMFKESKEDEKARLEKEKKEKEAHQRARLASDPTPVKSPASTTAPCMKKREVKKPIRRTMSISSIVLDWCKEMVKDYGIQIKNFSGSWNNGLAFCALIHKFNPDSFDFSELSPENRERNFQLAFDTAYEVKNIPKLLDVEDMVNMKNPEPRSVQCYVQWIWSVYGPTSGYGPSMEEIKQAQVS